MLTINQSAVQSPSEMRVTLFEVGDFSQRAADGGTVADRLAVKRRLQLTWAGVSPAALTAMLEAMGDGPFFQARYPDPMTGAEREATCYCEEKSAEVLRVAGGAPEWRDVTMTWIER